MQPTEQGEQCSPTPSLVLGVGQAHHGQEHQDLGPKQGQEGSEGTNNPILLVLPSSSSYQLVGDIPVVLPGHALPDG